MQNDTQVRKLFINGTTVDIFALNPATQYKARVRAIDFSGNAGAWSAEVNGIPSMDAVAEAGAQIFSGIGTPIDNPPQNATDGDLYIQDNGHIWKLIEGAWQDQMLDLTASDAARVYAVGMLAADASPVVADAILGSIAFSDDGRFWELTSKNPDVWTYRDDLTGPEGKPGDAGYGIGQVLPRIRVASISALVPNSYFFSANHLYISIENDYPYFYDLAKDCVFSIADNGIPNRWLNESNLKGVTVVNSSSNIGITNTEVQIARIPVTQLDEIDVTKIGDQADIFCNFSFGEAGNDAFGHTLSKRFRAYASVPVSDGFRIHHNGADFYLSEENDEDQLYFGSFKKGVVVWVVGNKYVYRGLITQAPIKILAIGRTYREWRFVTQQIGPAPLFNFTIDQFYDVVFTKPFVGSLESESTETVKPSVPRNLSVVADSSVDTNAVISFDAPSNDGGASITHYVLQHSTDDATWSNLAAALTARSYTHENLRRGSTHYYRVAAVNSIGQGEYSESQSFTVPQPTYFAAKTIRVRKETPGSGPENGEFQVYGTRVSGITYRLNALAINLRSEATYFSELVARGAGTFIFFDDANGNEVHGTLSNISYRSGEWSADIDLLEDTYARWNTGVFVELKFTFVGTGSVAPPVTPSTGSVPGAPTNNSASTTEGGSLLLDWDAPSSDGGSAITGYKIEWSTDNRFWNTATSNTGNTNTQLVISGLSDGVLRYLRVRALNAHGESLPSNSAQFQHTIPQPSMQFSITRRNETTFGQFGNGDYYYEDLGDLAVDFYIPTGSDASRLNNVSGGWRMAWTDGTNTNSLVIPSGGVITSFLAGIRTRRIAVRRSDIDYHFADEALVTFTFTP